LAIRGCGPTRSSPADASVSDKWAAHSLPVIHHYRRLFWLPAAVFERRAPAVMRGGSSFTTITRKYNRYLLQPPNHVTCQSPKRDPNVTGVRRRRNLVSSCICVGPRASTFIAPRSGWSQAGAEPSTDRFHLVSLKTRLPTSGLALRRPRRSAHSRLSPVSWSAYVNTACAKFETGLNLTNPPARRQVPPVASPRLPAWQPDVVVALPAPHARAGTTPFRLAPLQAQA